MNNLLLARRQTLSVLILTLLAVTAAHRATAQYTAPFVVTGPTVTTTAGTYGDGTGLDEPGANYTSFTIGAGTTINSGTAYGGSNVSEPGQYLIHTSTSTFTNLGTVDFTLGTYFTSAIFLDQGALSVAVANSGNVTASHASDGQTDLYITSTTGNISVSNTGTLATANGGLDGIPIWTQSDSGNIVITNAASALISAPDPVGRGAEVSTSGSGTISFTNNGTINTGQDIADLYTQDGSISVINTGSVTGTNNGFSTQSRTGNIYLFNSGYIGGVDSLEGDTDSNLTATNTGTIVGSAGINVAGATMVLTNSGYINADTGIGAESSEPDSPITILNTGTLTGQFGVIVYQYDNTTATTVTNAGLINTSNDGIYLYLAGTVIDSGNIASGADAIDAPSGSSVILRGLPTITGTISGNSSSTSASTLAFDLTLPASQLAAAKTQLDADIAAYAAQNGGDLAFVIDGMTYDISNFGYGAGDIIDGLAAARLYASVPGYRSLGTALDNLNSGTPQGVQILSALGNVPDAGLANALSELTPKSLQVFCNIAFDNNTFNATQINNHLANLRDGLTGFDGSQFTLNTSGIDPQLSPIRDHLLAYTPALQPGLLSDVADPVLAGVDMKAARIANTPPVPDCWSTFISGNVILANLNNSLPDQNSNYTTGAVSAGADYRLDDHFTVGALISYAHSGIDLDDRGSKATVDSYSPGLYTSYVDGGWYANGLATYVRNAYTEDRMIDIPGLAGDNHGATSGNQATGNLTGGYEFHRGAFKFGPIASLQYVHLDIDSINEDGAAALDVNSQSQDSLRTLLGFEARYAGRIGNVLLTPHFSASWQHEYLDNSNGITAQFNRAGGGSFSVQTDNPDHDSAFLDAGLDAALNSNVTLFIDYATQLGQSDFYAQSAQGGIRISF